MKFRKKPVVIEAVQWAPRSESIRREDIEIERAFFAFMRTEPEPVWRTEGVGVGCVVIVETLEGEMRCSPGDWLIRGVQGEVYPCKPDIFEATYDPVAADAEAAKLGAPQ